MATLSLSREKALIGFAAKLKCYINGQVVCELAQNQVYQCPSASKQFIFNCNFPGNPMSDTILIECQDSDAICITIKAGAWKPSLKVTDASGKDFPFRIVNPKKDKLPVPTGHEKDLVKFTPTKSVGTYFGVDEANHLWAVSNALVGGFKKSVPHSYDDILDFELLEDGESVIKGGLGSAAVGGFLFGGLGAIVGGATGKRKTKGKCTSLMIKITLNDMGHPTEYIKLVTSPTSKSGLIYKTAYQNAQEIISLLQVVMNQRDTARDPVPQPENTTSIGSDLRELKALLDEGIITQTEFDLKKKQILGL